MGTNHLIHADYQPLYLLSIERLVECVAKYSSEKSGNNIPSATAATGLWPQPCPAFIEVAQDDADVIVSKTLQLAGQLVVEALAQNHLNDQDLLFKFKH